MPHQWQIGSASDLCQTQSTVVLSWYGSSICDIKDVVNHSVFNSFPLSPCNFNAVRYLEIPKLLKLECV